jgi:metal-responsive CopG/Arc/MetJ family transcriptional regulator
MSRKKLTEKEKKQDFSISVNEELYNLMEEYMVDNNIKNRSKYIEHLVREDMKSRGEDVDKF